MLRLDKATYLSLPFKFIFSKKLSNCLWGSDLLLFSEFIYIYISYTYTVSIPFYNFIEFIILFYTFLVTFFVGTKNSWFLWFNLVRFQMCYLLLPVQVLLVILKVFVLDTLLSGTLATPAIGVSLMDMRVTCVNVL